MVGDEIMSDDIVKLARYISDYIRQEIDESNLFDVTDLEAIYDFIDSGTFEQVLDAFESTDNSKVVIYEGG